MNRASLSQPPRPGIGWKGFRLPPAAGVPSRWQSWVSSASAASCALQTARLRAVQLLAAAVAVAALAVACVAIFTVGRIAYPVGDALHGDRAAAAGTARIRAGIRLTIIALILAVIAALSGWWPSPASNPAVAVTGTTGQAWCGPLVSGPAGAISVRTATGIVTVPAQAIAQVSPVGRCP
jgi:hypothetical protein